MAGMNQVLDPEDDELDRLWRERYGQPLPLRGCSGLAWRLLNETNVTTPLEASVVGAPSR
jgi:hypothetical protein